MKQPTRILAWFAILGFVSCGPDEHAGASETLEIEVRETAGIRRFGYPIALTLPQLSSAPADSRFRLREGDKVVAAQFRPEQAGGGGTKWWLDFNISLMPNETRLLTVEYGQDVAPDAEPRGLEFRQTPDGYEIRNGSVLTWTVGHSLSQLLKSVDAGELHYLRAPGVRLSMAGPSGMADDLSNAVEPRITRSGPLAIAIRYELDHKAGALTGAKSTIDLTFPISKSWVEVDWKVDDPRRTVQAIRAEIAQRLNPPTDSEPTLVDFGASSLVYMSLGPATMGTLQARQAGQDLKSAPYWAILRGAANHLDPFVVQSQGEPRGNAEGWAHVMDRSRCLALAVAEFGKDGDDSIDVTAAGDVTIERKFGADKTAAPMRKSMRFWLHFVGFPPHVTAATSPQSMLSPLDVRRKH